MNRLPLDIVGTIAGHLSPSEIVSMYSTLVSSMDRSRIDATGYVMTTPVMGNRRYVVSHISPDAYQVASQELVQQEWTSQHIHWIDKPR